MFRIASHLVHFLGISKKKKLQKKAPKIIFFELVVLNKTKEMPLGFSWFRKIIVFSVSV